MRYYKSLREVKTEMEVAKLKTEIQEEKLKLHLAELKQALSPKSLVKGLAIQGARKVSPISLFNKLRRKKKKK